jgi:Leucine-rich repeat (LRR) protein
VEIIAQLPNLEELNLSDNLFQQLPLDLSSWVLVANLNISNINLDNFEIAVHALATMPSLKSLYVNLHEES